ncbi:MAG: ATP-binding protein [Candidatus Thiodiazotropha sp. (ex Lucinoma borealis)]|nr:ATP-binding protein [Candidatus Thiodiazotropha sp. (ex Lucinoma borealis)]
MLISLLLPKSTSGENPIRFAQPKGEGPGAITVLCGPNGSGKSFILRTLIELIDGKKAGALQDARGWSVERSGENSVSAFKPQHHPAQMNSIGVLSLQQASKTPQQNDDPLRLKLAVFGSLLRSVEGLPVKAFGAIQHAGESWMSDEACRRDILSQIPSDPEMVYWTSDGAEDLFCEFEKITGARLGLRQETSVFEVTIAFSDGNAASYNNWSDGQKSLFAILSAVFIETPDAYIFDEIENFLHPQFMSAVLDFLKRRVRQTILATHHPHLIFGNYIDKVYFVEKMIPKSARFPTVLKKQISQPSPYRKITKLSSDQTKLVNAYKLFDIKDAALLATASHVMSAVDFYLYDAVYNLFECSSADATPGLLPDRQSRAIANFIASYNPFPHSVLDWGAGLGRVLKETKKLGTGHPVDTYDWLLFEPFADASDHADWDSVKRTGAIRFISKRDDLTGCRVGVALLTNVLHILSPDQWSDAILDCWGAVSGESQSIILVTEVFPLLHPERHAVPLPRELLTTLFKRLGFVVYSRDFEVHGASSYCLALSQVPEEIPDREDLVRKVELLWQELHSFFLSTYCAIPKIDDPAARNEVLNAAFGMASISSWFAANSDSEAAMRF